MTYARTLASALGCPAVEQELDRPAPGGILTRGHRVTSHVLDVPRCCLLGVWGSQMYVVVVGLCSASHTGSGGDKGYDKRLRDK